MKLIVNGTVIFLNGHAHLLEIVVGVFLMLREREDRVQSPVVRDDTLDIGG